MITPPVFLRTLERGRERAQTSKPVRSTDNMRVRRCRKFGAPKFTRKKVVVAGNENSSQNAAESATRRIYRTALRCK